MKICWDNLEKLEFRPDRGDWHHKGTTHFYSYVESCKGCGEPFLWCGRSYGFYCSNLCTLKHRTFTWNKKISDSLKGRIIPQKVRDKIGKASKGRKLSPETRIKISLAKFGEKNPAWKGGLSCEPYCNIWADKEYKESIRERDGHKCLNPECNKKSTRLCVHHINYNKKDCHPNNLITICDSCNIKANYNREWHEEWYRAIFNARSKINTI